MGDFEGAIKIVNKIIPIIEKYDDKLHKEQELSFFYHIAYTYFGAGDYKEALSWINKVLNDNENTLRQDVYSYARLFNLVIHYELGNFDLLEYITKSTQRYLSKRQRDFQLELKVIDGIRKLIRMNDPVDQKELLINLRDSLSKMVMKPEDEIILRYFDFIKWTQSKIEGKSMAEIIRNTGSKVKA